MDPAQQPEHEPEAAPAPAPAAAPTILWQVQEVPEGPEDPEEELGRIGRQLLRLKNEPVEVACRALWGLEDGWNDDDQTDDDVRERLQANSSRALNTLAIAYSKLQQRCDGDEQAWHGVQRGAERYLKAFYYAQHALYAQAQMRRALLDIPDEDRDEAEAAADDERQQAPPPICVGLAHFCPPTDDPKATNGYQKLLLHLLQQAFHRQYRKREDMCFTRVKVPGCHDSHAWEACESIKDFIYSVTNKEVNFDMWANLTRGNRVLENAVQYLSNCRDPQFPKLTKDRRFLAFKNGIYQTKWQRDARGAWTGRFVPYCDPGFAVKIPDHVVACKFFDQDFVDHATSDWYAIPTPALQQVLDCQQYPEDVSRWMYVFIGRLMYEMNDVDRWQKMPFLEGQAATGKSTLLMHVCKNLYAREDVGVLSNNIEKKFGLSAFASKYLFIAPEVREDLGLDQAEFQSMVSGEDMSIAVKFGLAEQVQWRVPGILAGNQIPKWRDSAGSIARRLVVFNFAHKPECIDTTLGDRLHAEMPAIVLKCNTAYLNAAHDVGRDNLDLHLPAYFKETNKELSQEVNSVRHFLSSGQLVFGDDAAMPMTEFKKMYNDHCRDNGFAAERMNKSNYSGPFDERGINVRCETRVWRSIPKSGQWVIGLVDEATSAEYGGGWLGTDEDLRDPIQA